MSFGSFPVQWSNNSFSTLFHCPVSPKSQIFRKWLSLFSSSFWTDPNQLFWLPACILAIRQNIWRNKTHRDLVILLKVTVDLMSFDTLFFFGTLLPLLPCQEPHGLPLHSSHTKTTSWVYSNAAQRKLMSAKLQHSLHHAAGNVISQQPWAFVLDFQNVLICMNAIVCGLLSDNLGVFQMR